MILSQFMAEGRSPPLVKVRKYKVRTFHTTNLARQKTLRHCDIHSIRFPQKASKYNTISFKTLYSKQKSIVENIKHLNSL